MISVNLKRPPTIFGPYKLDRLLGMGEFGKVRLGFHEHTDEAVAIKFVKKQLVGDDIERRTKLAREIDILTVSVELIIGAFTS